ncbi:MAG: prolyl oligopeptidase family serine peptidase [Thermomicrobiales bacterium]
MTSTPDAAVTEARAEQPHDEFLWLEEIYGEQPLAWVAEQNAKTAEMLGSDDFDRMQARILEVLDSTDRIPMVGKYGDWYYNFWKDAEHPRGLWRRTTPESYRTASPEWETVLDIDALGKAEGIDWVFRGAQMLYPDYDRALLSLSPDGGDAVTLREFDVETKTFVEDGFVLPVAKMWCGWIDLDAIWVSTDFGPGSLTTSSYPRIAKRWRRGTPLAEAETVMEVPESHMLTAVGHDHTRGYERDIAEDRIEFFTATYSLVQGDTLVKIDVPLDASVEPHKEWLLVRPRSDWEVNGTIWPAGSLLVANLDAWIGGDRTLEALFTPDAHTSLEGWSWTKHYLLLTLLQDVATRIEVLDPANGWARSALAGAPALHTVSVSPVDADESDDYWMVVSGFLTPSTLQTGTIGGGEPETVKTSPAFFDASGYRVEQHFATSLDGTRVPYFQVSKQDLVLDGSNPTLLYGYGGFEIALTPGYNGVIGRAWLDRGGVYVVANIRGGGEYGPTWHTSAMKENRHRAYEDFAAVARDLIARGVTSPAHLGCEGGSNGGLLVGNMLTQYPELFGAIVCEVPLLDMRRYTKLSAGFSWIAEYGDPDVPEQWAYVQTFSPYHNLKQGTAYPPVLFYTATSDDRVGPVQARKMAARMEAMGIPKVWFYENREGGHGGAADNKQTAHMRAAAYEFLLKHLS